MSRLLMLAALFSSTTALAGADVSKVDVDDEFCFGNPMFFQLCQTTTGTVTEVTTPSGNVSSSFHGEYALEVIQRGSVVQDSVQYVKEHRLFKKGEEHVFSFAQTIEYELYFGGGCVFRETEERLQVVDGEVKIDRFASEEAPCE